MASNYWIKLYHEILEDPKMCRLTDRQYRRVIELFLLAGDYEKSGVLPPYDDIDFRLRFPEGLKEDLESLVSVGILSIDETDGYFITRWDDRQSAMNNTERSQRRRERERKQNYYSNDNATLKQRKRTDSVVDIDKIRIDETKKPRSQKVVKETQEFLDWFMLKTNLKPPKGKLLDNKWLIPLTQMLDLVGFDIEKAKMLMMITIKDCDKSNWSFSTPYQIQSRYNGIAGKQKRKGVSAGTEFNPKDIK